ncbi:TetR/AcrR family transcriptional regulator [Nocardia otitidiscaviarum]|uniref:Bacterial regulatory proteins, tetR family n=1 Tax=Nocardia otitidiscaviarum TaxID=1823 RepID=A0A378YUB2_9NOCA|nr:TetR/AcrR family transcriptional regulator [Nocardia otitidiscaviarum]MBF6135288.1 TetR/AcrR family transcriptional regulator [Nocardia otitidiscaviarum]MBF6181080.1 TetR/AcrR family transcriptional regulator [Nocardia otitidiscaviarum]MBF6237258.1 TetR/AcrR family transcriptional regulator [Nocardia otitidiscaviarum]MBF6487109.1 TetR/AcrR family transcriptional regulator [Nocardia otitidiscaviarum]SUA80714.1 Bacterial regulatory proteins, tetR family [Nocardia otitidiscaviarum]
MARPKQFDEERAVDAAMRAFWRAGYDGTSTQELCAATGLGRSSIYNTFSSKHDLFQRALRRYMADKNADTFAVLDGPGPVRDRIARLLEFIIDAPEGDPLGCLVVNATVELGERDPEIARLLRADEERRLLALATAIAEGQRAGEISGDRDPRDLARFIVTTIGGMRVAARGGADRAALAAIAEVALGCL